MLLPQIIDNNFATTQIFLVEGLRFFAAGSWLEDALLAFSASSSSAPEV